MTPRLSITEAQDCRDLADTILHFARHGQYPTAGEVIACVVEAGRDVADVVVRRWAESAAIAMAFLPECSGSCGPVWLLESDRVTTNAAFVTSPELWAGRYIAAFTAGDAEMTTALFNSCNDTQLSAAADALMRLTSRWVDRRERSLR